MLISIVIDGTNGPVAGALSGLTTLADLHVGNAGAGV
jgi:hypothetical protein